MVLKSRRTLLAVSAGILLAAGFLSRRFPPVHYDEIAGAVTATNFSHGHGARYTLKDDVLPPGVPASPSNWNGRPLYTLWAAAIMRLVPFDWWAARFSSLAAGVLLMLFCAAIGRQLGSARGEKIMLGLLLVQPVFWMGVTVVNELIIASALITGLVWFGLLPISRTDWGLLLFGLLAPLLILVHPFGAGAAAALILFRILLLGRPSGPQLLKLGGGLIAGGLLVLLGNPSIHDKTPFYYELARPPLFRLTTVVEWLGQLRAFFFQPSSFYYPGAETFTWGLPQSLIAMWVGLILGLVGFMGARPKDPSETRTRRALLTGLGVMTGSLILLSARIEGFYFAFILPFSLPLIYLSLKGARKPIRMMILAALVFSAGSFAFFVKSYTASTRSHAEVAGELKLLAGNATRIMAPNIFWFDFPQADFKDASVLVVSRYFTEGRFEPELSFQSWRPDVLIIDPPLLMVLSKEGNPVQTLSNHLGIGIDYLGSVDSGRAYEALHVVRLNWPQEK